MSTPVDSHPVRTGVISTVVGTIVVGLLAEVWPPVKTVLTWCWAQLQVFICLFFTDYAAPGWLLALLGFLALLTILRWGAALRHRAPEDNAPHEAYTTDYLYGAKWRWKWQGHDVQNLWCFCPSCDSELVYDDSSCRDVLRMSEPRTEFICEHCGHNLVASIKGGNKSYALSAVQREIRRKLRTGQAPARAEA